MKKIVSDTTKPKASAASEPPVPLPKKASFTKPGQTFKPRTFFVKQISFHGTQHRG